MLLRLLLLKQLSPTFYRMRLAGLVAFGVLLLAFVGECGYLMYQQLSHPSPYRMIHSTEPSR